MITNEFPQTLRESASLDTSEPSLEVLREKLLDPDYLPTLDEIKKAFPTYEDWSIFYKNNNIYELWNKEYIDAFADYLAHRATELGKLSILEIGAGDGKLSRLLTKVLQEKGLGAAIEIVATDSNSWGLSKNSAVVEMDDFEEAIDLYKPNIVISSWMPFGVDWTKAIRQFDFVKEYILIGDPECTGDQGEYPAPSATWGKIEFTKDMSNPYGAPIRLDSFERQALTHLWQFQICRGDIFENHRDMDVGGMDMTQKHSITISFKRVEQTNL